MFRKISSKIKKIFPSSLFYRFILMAIIPMFLIQMISLYIFFERYWDKTTRNNISTLLNEIKTISYKYDKCTEIGCNKKYLIDNFNVFDKMNIVFKENSNIEELLINRKKYKKILVFKPKDYLKSVLYNSNIGKFNLRDIDNYYTISLFKEDGILEFMVKKSSLIISKVNLIIFWNTLSFLIISYIAFLFVRNQAKSIEKLKDFANDFSYLEKDNTNFKPTGADEIREVGFAFLNVMKKLKNLINARTTMLAQISHDLRTPLTRMKLQVEFIEDEETAKFFKQDMEEMEKMINEYLLFAKGDIDGSCNFVNIKTFFSSIINDYKRSKYKNINIYYDLKMEEIYIKEDSFRRCINNIINNSLRYRNRQTSIFVKTSNNNLIVEVEDDGDGLPKWMFKKIKKPFFGTKNKNNNNIGLGLSIVQHVVDMHGGKVYFTNSKKLGGLSVNIIIPIIKKL